MNNKLKTLTALGIVGFLCSVAALQIGVKIKKYNVARAGLAGLAVTTLAGINIFSYIGTKKALDKVEEKVLDKLSSRFSHENEG